MGDTAARVDRLWVTQQLVRQTMGDTAARVDRLWVTAARVDNG